jgi:rhodanese-related sulfurtransferase
MQTITPRDLASWRADPGRPPPQLLDVREPWEVEICHIDGALPIPMRAIPAAGALDALDPAQPVVCLCHHGARSMQVALYLESRGFEPVFNLTGGIDAWARDVEPSLRRY